VLRHRIIPVLTIDERRLVKTVRFRQPRYLGDPLNAVRLFNEKEVDEIVILDIGATRRSRPPDFAFISDLASECFMPMAYGGGITSVDDASRILSLGVEKVVMNTAAIETPAVVSGVARTYGNQAVIADIDVRRRWTGKSEGVTRAGTKSTGRGAVELARTMEQAGAGELLITSIAHDGMMQGYNLELIKQVAAAVTIPVIACGGAGSLNDLRLAIREAGASAASAGSLFVYQGKHRAVLVNFPSQEIRDRLFA
jgi:cyclase